MIPPLVEWTPAAYLLLAALSYAGVALGVVAGWRSSP